ncbi:metal ABC transporter permease [Candidatus Symbiopectobacterium endolongispinus]|nr:LysR family transcriptional regulator [Candidatus Symbiopectobacterium sp. PLON1]MBT9429000.1 metal ABC transporter permease [Candidatus Symbiopectobacterium endolongispinus]
MRHYPGDDIGVFLAVCDSGNFTTAAALLGLTPSAVTKAIQRLENRLKTPLFTRTTRQQTITAEGVIYRDACRTARHEVDRVEMLLASITAEPAGQLAVSVPPLLGAQVVTPTLLALCQQWPQLSISVSASVEMANLFDGSVDLAVRVGELPDAAGIVAKRLGTQRIVLCGTPGYFAQLPPLHGIDDLHRHILIGTLKEGYAAPWHFQLADKTHRVMTPDTRLLLDGALMGCIAPTLSATPLGCFLLLRRMSLIGDALSHTVLPGVAIGYLLSGMSLLAMGTGGFIAGLIVALLSGFVSRNTALKEDASFAGLYLGSLALGVTLVSLRGPSVDLLHVLFGSILAVDRGALIDIGLICSVSILLLACLYRALVIESFDTTFMQLASPRGRTLIHALFLAQTGL